MGVKRNRILAVVIALVMVLTSVVGVFASSPAKKSIEQGSSNANDTYANTAKGTIKVDTASNYSYEVVNRKGVKGDVKAGQPITGLKKGDRVVITTKEGKSYRWMVRTKISHKKGSKYIKWKKIKGATRYAIFITDKKGKQTYKHVSGKVRKYKCKKGYTYIVRPCKKVGNVTYVGQVSKKYKVKK
jgi:hypothetical protein